MPEEKPEPSAPRRRRRSAIVLILPIVVLAAIALWFWTSHVSEPAQADGENPVRSTLHLESFVLNAADTEQRAYLRVGIDLGLRAPCRPATVPAHDNDVSGGHRHRPLRYPRA